MHSMSMESPLWRLLGTWRCSFISKRCLTLALIPTRMALALTPFWAAQGLRGLTDGIDKAFRHEAKVAANVSRLVRENI